MQHVFLIIQLPESFNRTLCTISGVVRQPHSKINLKMDDGWGSNSLPGTDNIL